MLKTTLKIINIRKQHIPFKPSDWMPNLQSLTKLTWCENDRDQYGKMEILF